MELGIGMRGDGWGHPYQGRAALQHRGKQAGTTGSRSRESPRCSRRGLAQAAVLEPRSRQENCPGQQQDRARAEPGALLLQGGGPSPSIMLSELLRRLLSTFMSAWRPCNIWQLGWALIRGL